MSCIQEVLWSRICKAQPLNLEICAEVVLSLILAKVQIKINPYLDRNENKIRFEQPECIQIDEVKIDHVSSQSEHLSDENFPCKIKPKVKRKSKCKLLRKNMVPEHSMNFISKTPT